MNYKKCFFVCISLSFLTCTHYVRAQDLSVVSSNGTITALDLTTIESIVFKNNNLVIQSADCEDNYHSLFFTDMISFDEVNSIQETLTGNSSILLYPNPVSTVLTVERSSGTVEQGYIYSIIGETVLTFTASSTTEEISVSELPSGVYFIALDQQLSKFVKQ